MSSLTGKVVVVTGASSGIGACLAEKLVAKGMKVVGLARRLDKLEALKQRVAKHAGVFYPIKCDLAKEEEILAAFAGIDRDLGPVNVLVNNAGIIANETIIDGKTATLRQLLDVNVLASTICVREASRSMRKHQVPGHVVNVNSIAGHDAGRVKIPVSIYCGSKYALAGITESLRNELRSVEPAIKVTSVSPGTVRTSMVSAAFGIPDDVLRNAPFLEPEDVAEAVLYVISAPAHVQIDELTLKNVKEP